MIEYLPWSKKVLAECVSAHKCGLIPILDIELTAKCTGACCIYCDSKPSVAAWEQEGEMNFSLFEKIFIDAKSRGLKWIFTCGLGEPLEDGKFWDMIHWLKAYDIKISIFSYGLFIHDIHVARELKKHDVNIILKMDTFDESKFDTILNRKGMAKKIYASRDLLLEAGYGERNGYTDLAFSIVPTALSIDGIREVISFCKRHGIFASIGELEQAGEVINNNLNDTLSLSTDILKQLKEAADIYADGIYMRPICPCILTGLHIDNCGNCAVDKDTGLNCKWFLLKNPHTVKIGNIREESIFTLFEKVNAYRKNVLKRDII